MFPTAVAVPEDVAWRRDIYRSLDLTQDENAALYFPVEPQGNQVNLFTLLFRLLNTGKIPAYECKMSGLEDFSASNRMHFKDMLERFHIFYEVEGNTIKVDNSDIPSSEVLSFNVKESSYYDQNTATYHSRIVALCPMLHRADEFVGPSDGGAVHKEPMFWVKYDDISTYLSGQMIMTSNVNNAAKMSMADFFATNHYKGTIYATTNMQGKSLAQYCGSEEKMKNEQERIEKEMKDFEEHIWTEPVDSAQLALEDSLAQLSTKSKKTRTPRTKAKPEAETPAVPRAAARRGVTTPAKKEKKEKPAGGTTRVSVRRQRH